MRLFLCSSKFPPVYENIDATHCHPGIGAPIKTSGSASSYYSTLQAAYNAASDGDTIQVIAAIIIESISIDLSKSVIFSGGYDGAFTVHAGNTALDGTVTISGGTLSIENFELQ